MKISYRSLVSLAAAGSLLAGCGAGTEGHATGASSAPALTAAGHGRPLSDGPVDTVISIDATAVRRGDDVALAQDYRAAALDAAETTITHGGHLEVRLFARVAGRSFPFHQDDSPAREVEGKDVRATGDGARRAHLAAALDIALGLAPPPSDEVAAQLDRVSSGAGSDVARAVGATMDAAGPAGIAVVLSDGLVHETADGGLVAQRLFSGETTPKALGRAVASQAASRAGDDAVALLRIAGVGATAGRRDLEPGEADLLVKMWDVACGQLPAESCDIRQELRPLGTS